jgi:hypothetical protein
MKYRTAQRDSDLVVVAVAVRIVALPIEASVLFFVQLSVVQAMTESETLKSEEIK